MDPRARAWLARRTSTAADWPTDLLRKAKGPRRVSVVLPARDEAATVGPIVAAILAHLGPLGCGATPIVDEVLVVDSGSTDETAAIAAAAGARVVSTGEIRPDIPAGPGKGEAMWRGVIAATGDVIVFIDADLEAFTADYVSGLLGPLLTDPDVELVKACYDRPGDGLAGSGGRITEFVARPLLAVHRPHLTGIIQPIVGEYAARRRLLEEVPFPTGYGIDIALLLDADDRYGLDAIAQVDLGVRRHRHHGDAHLAVMAAEVWAAASTRLGLPPAGGPSLVRYHRRATDGALTYEDAPITTDERPPVASLPSSGLRVEVDA